MGIKLLHISSAGRSGSTLLGMALNARTGFFYGGEVYSLWNDDHIEALCGCGEALTKCPIWRGATDNALGQSGLGNVAELRAIRDETVRLGRLAIRRIRPDIRQRAELYLGMAGGLYSALADITGARVIVDSSQYIAHSLLTSEIAGVDPYIIHLVRDPRAVVFSWSRARTWPTRTGGITLKKGMIAAIQQWMAHNLKLMAILRRSSLPHLVLRYEDFAKDPNAAARRIMGLTGEPMEPELTDDTNTIVVGSTHAIQANPLRFHRGALTISPDEQWRKQLTPRDRLITTMLTYPLLHQFGYATRVD